MTPVRIRPDIASRLALGLVLVLGACTPEIIGGAYYCGPERLCPPHLECDDNTYLCVAERYAEPFSCPDGSESAEPDDELAAARDLGVVTCGSPVGNLAGCISTAGDVDLIAFSNQSECNGADPHMEISLHFPIALVPLTLELLDESGTVIQVGEGCTLGGDVNGTHTLCLDFEPGIGDYYLRITDDAAGPDCDGDCRNNQYTLDIHFPLA